MAATITIALCGDPGIGKTTAILGFAGLAVVFGLSQAEWAAVSNAVAAVAAAVAMFVAEAK